MSRDYKVTGENFPNFVDRVLNYSTSIRSVSIITLRKCSPERLKTWISTALSHKLELFEINVSKSTTCFHEDCILLPLSLFTSNSLRKLKLIVPCTFNNVVANNCFPNITSLYLAEVRFLNENPDIDTLSLTFPILETLEIKSCKWVRFVEIYAPALTYFHSYTSSHVARDCMIKVVCPRLAKSETTGNESENVIMVDGGSQVVYACMTNEGDEDDIGELMNTGAQVGKQLDRFLINVEVLKRSSFLAKALRSRGLWVR